MYYLPLNLTSSGEKVALAQAVERHLSTYTSLPLNSRKSGSEKLARNEIEWKCIMVKVQHAKKFVLPDVSTRGNYVGSLESAAIPLQIFSENLCKAIKSYNFRSSDHHQGMVAVETDSATLWCSSGWRSWFSRTTYIYLKIKCVPIEVQRKLDQLNLKLSE